MPDGKHWKLVNYLFYFIIDKKKTTAPLFESKMYVQVWCADRYNVDALIGRGRLFSFITDIDSYVIPRH